MKKFQGWSRTRTVVGLAAVLALAACGGGGGGGSTGGPASTVSVSGLASKGLLAYAKVTAYAVKSNGTADETKVLGSDISKADGSYTISGLPPSTPVILKVTPLSAEGTRPATTMKDEATGGDVAVPVDSGFSLSAAVVLDATGTTSAQITPFTDMAAKLAQSQAPKAAPGATIADVIQSANGAVADALGVSLTTPPTFGSDGKPTNEAAVKLAAVSQMAKDNTGGVVTAACPNAEDRDTPLETIKCALKALTDEVVDSADAGAPLLSPGLVESLNSAQDIVENTSEVSASNMTQGSTPVVVGGEAKTAIQEAKSLITSVRGTATALLKKDDVNSLAARAQALADNSRSVASPLDASTLTMLGAISEAILAHQDGASGSFPLNVGQSNFLGLSSGCEYTSSTESTELDCKVIQRVVWRTVAFAPEAYEVVYHRFHLKATSATNFTVTSALATVYLTGGMSGYSYGTEVPLSTDRIGAVEADDDSLYVSGEFAPGYESQWTGSGENIVALGTHQTMVISMSAQASGSDSTRTNISGDFRAFDGSEQHTRVTLAPGSYTRVKDDVGLEEVKLILEGQHKASYKIGGTLTLSNFAQTADRNGPMNGVLTGYITDNGGSAKLFDGTMTMVMPKDSGVGQSVTLDGTLITTGTNTLTVNLTAKQPVKVGDYELSGRYTQGATTFLLTAIDKAGSADDQLTLTTTAGGVGFTAKPSDTTVDIKKGTTVVGQFNVGTSRLVYADGSYEQF